ncbi:MAG TPA: hypothetical protein VER55_01715, partial [Ardenticatenaceae bacterium]|nr:hypothetical protein [Ardenticatenaceae bacterium]
MDGKVMLGLPCDELTVVPDLFPEPVRRILAASPDRSAFLLSCAQGNFCIYEPQTQSVHALDERIRATERAGYSWSPTGAYLAMTHVLSMQGAFEMATYLVNVHTAQVEDVVSWRHRDAEGGFSGPIWLAEDRFLIQEALETGPLLVTIGQDPIQVAPELFGRPTSPQCEQEPCGTFLAATGAPVTGSQTSHIVLYQVGTASEDPEL